MHYSPIWPFKLPISFFLIIFVLSFILSSIIPCEYLNLNFTVPLNLPFYYFSMFLYIICHQTRYIPHNLKLSYCRILQYIENHPSTWIRLSHVFYPYDTVPWISNYLAMFLFHHHVICHPPKIQHIWHHHYACKFPY